MGRRCIVLDTKGKLKLRGERLAYKCSTARGSKPRAQLCRVREKSMSHLSFLIHRRLMMLGCFKEAIYLQRFLRESGFDESRDLVVFCDNRSRVRNILKGSKLS